ncbi:MAG: VCBS repeat-containing protein [Pyrinomonadaceae bacterium]|nr:VCBS repeat-containing protein [Pyrinomonadaceae bacterium]
MVSLLSFVPSAAFAAPTVTTGSRTALRRTSATLNGTVSANGEITTVIFEYGVTTAYGITVTATQSPIPLTAVNVAVSFPLVGVLTPNTDYHFRVVAVNGSGTTYGPDSTFRTLVAGSSTYYVDKTNSSCNDVGSGTAATPFCSINRALGTTVPYADAGDTVRVLAGTYAETVKWDSTNGGAGIPLTISAAPGVIVTGLAAGNGFQITSHSYIVVDGFTVSNTAGYGIYAIASNHLTISNNHVISAGTATSGNTRAGIYINNSTDSVIEGNITERNSSHGIMLTSGASNNMVSHNISFGNASEFQRDACGIDLVNNSISNTIIHNITYSNEDTGLNFYSGSSNNQVVGNVTYGNGDHGIDNNAAPNNTIVGNTVHGNVTVGINIEGATAPGSGGATVRNNILMNNGLLRQDDGSTSTGYAGNIEVDPRSLVGTALDHNQYYLTPAEGGTIQVIWNGTSYTTLAAFQSAVPGQEANAIVGDPLFTSRTPIGVRPHTAPYNVAINAGDYHINAGSPAIDSADSDAPNEPTFDLDGNARVDDPLVTNTGSGTRAYDDRGAYEYQPPATYLLSVAKTGTGSGTVTSEPTGIDCGSTCSASYPVSTPVTLSAAAGTGSTFTGWSGEGCSGTDTCQVTMNTAKSVSANFTIIQFTLNYSADPNGSISGISSQIVNYGGSGTPVTAVPNAGYHFIAWSDGVLTATRTDTNVTANLGVTANFMITLPVLSVIDGDDALLVSEPTGTIANTQNDFALSAIDADSGQTLAFSIITPGSCAGEATPGFIGASIVGVATSGGPPSTATGTLRIAAGANAAGSYCFTLRVSDGIGGTAERTVALTISAANSTPVLAAIDDDDAVTVGEPAGSSSNTQTDLALSASDLDSSQTIGLSVVSLVICTQPGATPGFIGASIVDASSVPGTPPEASTATGTLRITAGPNAASDQSSKQWCFGVKAVDGAGGQTVREVTLTVTRANSTPLLSAIDTDDQVAVSEPSGGASSSTSDFALSASDLDMNQPLTFSLQAPLSCLGGTAGFAGASVLTDTQTFGNIPTTTSTATGRLRIVAGPNDAGTYCVGVRVTDRDGATADRDVRIDVSAANSNPDINDPGTLSVTAGSSSQFDVFADDADNGQTLSFSIAASQDCAGTEFTGPISFGTTTPVTTTPTRSKSVLTVSPAINTAPGNYFKKVQVSDALVTAARCLNILVAPPPLGTYPDTTIPLSANATVVPDIPTNSVTSVNVSTSTSFNGRFEADPVTGVVRVTNAHPAGDYSVTVTAFNGGGVTATRTFTLTVTNGTACNGNVSFSDSADVSVGTFPFSVAVGDFNNDGKQDIAVANSNSATLSVRLGDGLGTFFPVTDVAVGSGPFLVAVGDFNNDGNQDIASANINANNVSIRLGDGLGGFGGSTSVSAGNYPLDIAIGDFNNDRKQDIAVVNGSSNSVSIRLGDGLGGFNGTTEVSVGRSPRSAAIGDFNSDGNIDLAVSSFDTGIVSIHIGNGQGGFSSPTNVSVGGGPFEVAIGDFNNDGTQDIAAANNNSNTVSIRMGDGIGGFTGSTNVSVGLGSYWVALGDFNNDGKADLATSNQYSNNLSIRMGDGGGGFSGTTNLSVGIQPGTVAIGDFNTDGKQDLVSVNYRSNNASVRLGGCTPVVNLAVSANTGTEADTTAITVTATASDPVVGDQTVSLGVTGTDITAGDYMLTNGTITIPNGSTTGSVTFTVVNDLVYEGTETATLMISSPSAGIALGATTSQIVTITDNDHLLTYSAGPNGSVSGTTPQTVNDGSDGTQVTAVPEFGYHFVNWSDLSTANPRTDTNVTTNISVTALFEINKYSISGNVHGPGNAPIEGVTVTIAGGVGGSTTTNSFGDYSLTGLVHGGSYVITPSYAGYTFNPANRNHDGLSADVTGADFALFGGGYEAEITAPYDTYVAITDYVKTGLFAVGIETPDLLSNEFQRADSSPRATRGDGLITAADYVQAGRYAVGLDNLQPAGGTLSPGLFSITEMIKELEQNQLALLPRIISAEDASSSQGQTVIVSIKIDANGDENGFGFTISYDGTKLSSPVVSTGADMPLSSPFANTLIPGKVGVITALPTLGTMPAGTREIVRIQFQVAPDAPFGPTPISFTGAPPVVNMVSSAEAGALPTTFTAGTVTILAPTAAEASVGGIVLTSEGQPIRNARLTLTDQSGAVRTAVSNSFGFFRFDEVAVGETYVLNVRTKSYVFAPQIVSVTDEVTNLMVIAVP